MDRQFEKLDEFEERVYEVCKNVMEDPHESWSCIALRKCWKHFLKKDEERKRLQELLAVIDKPSIES